VFQPGENNRIPCHHGLSGWLRAGVALLIAFLVGYPATMLTAGSRTDEAQLPKIFTNEAYIQELSKKSRLDIGDPLAVFRHVLNSLPPRVKVYPTENYYYFHFYQNGARYAGNLRFDVEMRDKGILLFNYFRETRGWFFDENDNRSILGRAEGVIVEKVQPLLYKVSAAGTTVLFELNDLSDHRPPPSLLSANETYLGPVFDESGIAFFLVFNSDLKIFHYILDETRPVLDELVGVQDTQSLVVGRRTGFAYFQERGPDRKVLVGVYGPNAEENNYFDGPFDQLPDNFLKGDTLRQAILATSPELAGSIDRFGNTDSGESRFLISPYLHYNDESELVAVETCIANALESAKRKCFALEETTSAGGPQ